jgi:hypothetical protein
MKISFLPLVSLLLLLVSCITSPQRLSGKTDIPMLLPSEKYATWKIDEADFDQSRYYVISKYSPDDKFISVHASDEGDPIAPTNAKKVMIPEIGLVPYRRCSLVGDGGPPRFETDPFSRDDGHGGKVYYFVRVVTGDGDQEAMMKSVKWAAPGTAP